MKLKILIFLLILINLSNCLDIYSSSNNDIFKKDQQEEFCPFPLKFRNRTGSTDDEDYDRGYLYARDNSSCLLPCPSPIYSDKEINALSIMVKSSGTISFITSLVLLLIYSPLINRIGLNRHSTSIFFLTIGIFLIMLTDIVYVDKGNKLICPNSHRYSRQTDPGCSLTGVLFQYGTLLSVFSWFSLVLDLFLTLKKINSTKKSQLLYILLLMGIAIILTLLPLAGNSYGYLVTGLACWILNPMESIYYFWAPFIITLFLGTIFISLIIFEIYKVSKGSNNNNSSNQIIFKLHIKPLIIVFIIYIQFLFILAFNSLINNNYDEYSKRMDNYIDCLYLNGGSSSSSSSSLKSTICTLKTIPFPMEFLVLLFLRLMGIEVLLFYAFSSTTKNIILNSFLINNQFINKRFPNLKNQKPSIDFSNVNDQELKVVNNNNNNNSYLISSLENQIDNNNSSNNNNNNIILK